jgi:hypothetical protein
MYLPGHIAIGYLVAWAFARWRKQKLSLWLAFTVGIVPDYDILFEGVGLAHHTYTHSLLLWIPVVVALALWKRKTIPYVAGILSHLLIGDFLVSSIPILLPLSNVTVGLNLGMPSAADALLEPASLILMLTLLFLNGDFRRALNGERSNLLMAIPLASMSALTWLAAGQPELGGLVTYGFSRLALQTVSIGEILLAAFLVGSIAVTSVKEAGLMIAAHGNIGYTSQSSQENNSKNRQTTTLQAGINVHAVPKMLKTGFIPFLNLLDNPETAKTKKERLLVLKKLSYGFFFGSVIFVSLTSRSNHAGVGSVV